MRRQPTPTNLDKTRMHIVSRVRELRVERRWTQAELAEKLGLSQARLSEVERGGGSLTAEQLVLVLRLFNVRLEDVVGLQPVEDELQNALARLGALHLREVATALPSERVASARAAVRETLLAPRDTRLLLALAPVLVANVDGLNLDVLHDELSQLGFPARVPWLVDNVRAALGLTSPTKASAPWRRAATVLGDFLERHPPPGEAELRLDYIDGGVRSSRTLAHVRDTASIFSRRWGVLSELQPSDFADALGAADAAG
jgi:transcriptional regulator with XRE-family HTH domain